MEPHDPALPLDEVVTLLERTETDRRRTDARRLRLLADAVGRVFRSDGQGETTGLLPGGTAPTEIAYRSLRAELATAFHVSEYQVERQLTLAHHLAEGYPATLSALEEGAIAYQHAQVIADEGLVIGTGDSPEVASRRREYERQALEVAIAETPNRLKPVARRLSETWAERTIDERSCAAETLRRVIVVDAEDGMADIVAHLPAIEAYAIKDRLTRIACTIERTEQPESGAVGSASPRRTRDQLRADAFSELLLESDVFSLTADAPAEAIQARIQLIAPVDAVRRSRLGSGSAALGGDQPTELTGYGPISARTAREVIGSASHWEQISTDRDTGEVLSVDRYRPSEEMRRLLGARDRHCRFPGCRVPITRCDIDHTIDAAKGGPTATDNMAHLCRGHHTLKHHSDWRVEQLPRGTLRWTSPAGRTHYDRPPGMSGAPPRRRGGVRFEPSPTETAF